MKLPILRSAIFAQADKDVAASYAEAVDKRVGQANLQLDQLQQNVSSETATSAPYSPSIPKALLKASLQSPWTYLTVAIEHFPMSWKSSRQEFNLQSMYLPLVRMQLGTIARQKAISELQSAAVCGLISQWTHNPEAMGSESLHQKLVNAHDILDTSYRSWLHATEELYRLGATHLFSTIYSSPKDASPFFDRATAAKGQALLSLGTDWLTSYAREYSLNALHKNSLEYRALKDKTGHALSSFSSDHLNAWHKELRNCKYNENLHTFSLNLVGYVPLLINLLFAAVLNQSTTRCSSKPSVLSSAPEYDGQQNFLAKGMYALHTILSIWAFCKSGYSFHSLSSIRKCNASTFC